MILETKKIETTPKNSTFETLESQSEFDWRKCWYPVCFLQDFPINRPYRFSLYEEPFVLFKNTDGQIICLTDRCAHRAARLSDGQIIDGRIECLYHGWQYGQDGKCLHIPQLSKEAKIPVSACVSSFKVIERQGIIWIWAGEAEAAVDELIPTVPDWDKPECFNLDYMRDLPYDQSYFIENVIDPAHIPISHEGIFSDRTEAQPLEIEVLESSHQGIRGRYRKTKKPNQPWQLLDFVAPNLVLYRLGNGEENRFLGTALYSIPLGRNRCRILVRNYSNFFDLKTKLMPPWLDHLITRNKVLEGDLQIVVEQKAQIERLGKKLKELYLPLKTSDTLVVAYRRWLDKYGSSLPFYQGFSTAQNIANSEDNKHLKTLDRFSQHTLICNSCNQAYRLTKRLQQSCIGVAIAFAAIAILTDTSGIKIAAVSTSITLIILAVMAQRLKTQFEDSYTRHE
ncbi:aromatic ring-hydroxylating dioxygenase subunit alpha [Nostoc sp.]|uniref:aromatic ring-hydroxylating dioxygenase subunit alpha n=1 Tax=Nostoc sp. TaxID=1180 RepID=UPI002FFC5B9B